jgi:hypothetical protein
MRLLDMLTSTKRPTEECSILPPDAVIYRLLYINRPTAPYKISRAPSEGASLVAEWKLDDPCWRARFAAAKVSKVVRILLKTHADTREVHALDQEFTVTWEGDVPKLTGASSFLVGVTPTFSFSTNPPAFTETVCEGNLQSYCFTTAELKEPLQEAVTECGWTYRPVSKPTKL